MELNSTAVVQFFKESVVALYRRWAPEVRARLLKPKDKWIAMLELRDVAGKQGWDFKQDSLQLLDLMNAISEAGRLGTLMFIGRPYEGLSDRFLYAQARIEIPKEAWANMQLSADGFIDLDCADNAKTRLQRRNPIGEDVYADIYADRRAAKLWLRTDAALVRGRTAAKEVAWEAEHRRR
jgi:hypothetical protein